jgi:hypothetical protein
MYFTVFWDVPTSPERRSLSTRLYRATSQKMVIFIPPVWRNWHLFVGSSCLRTGYWRKYLHKEKESNRKMEKFSFNVSLTYIPTPICRVHCWSHEAFPDSPPLSVWFYKGNDASVKVTDDWHLYNILMYLSTFILDVTVYRKFSNLPLHEIVGNWIDGSHVQFGRSRLHHGLVHFRSEVMPHFSLAEKIVTDVICL